MGCEDLYSLIEAEPTSIREFSGKKLAIDASFLYLRFKEVNASYDSYVENGQSVPFRGTYKSNALLPGIGVTYKL